MRAASYSVKTNKPGIDFWQCNSIYCTWAGILERRACLHVLMQLVIQRLQCLTSQGTVCTFLCLKKELKSLQGIPFGTIRTSSPGTGRTQLIRSSIMLKNTFKLASLHTRSGLLKRRLHLTDWPRLNHDPSISKCWGDRLKEVVM